MPPADPKPSVRRRWSERGAALAALLACLTIMVIGLGVAAPTWHHMVQDEKERELLYRGWAIAQAIHQHKKRMSIYPGVLDNMLAAKDLRKSLSTDPMSKDGKWQLIRDGRIPMECGVVPGAPPQGGNNLPGSPGGPMTGSPGHGRGAGGGPGAAQGGPVEEAGAVGGIIGVRSTSKEQSLRTFLGKNHYNEWCFTVQSITDNSLPSHIAVHRQGEAMPVFAPDEKRQRREWDGHPPLP